MCLEIGDVYVPCLNSMFAVIYKEVRAPYKN